MKQNRGQRAASVVRAPNHDLVVVDIARQRWRSRIFLMNKTGHTIIGQDLTEEMMVPDVPPEPDDWIARLARQLQQSEQPAPASDELHAGATVAAAAPAATGRSFWSYAEDTKPIPALT